jgi:hypothetical protein
MTSFKIPVSPPLPLSGTGTGRQLQVTRREADE